MGVDRVWDRIEERNLLNDYNGRLGDKLFCLHVRVQMSGRSSRAIFD